MAETSLIFNILAVDNASRAFAKVRSEAVSTKAVLAAALGPGLLPILAASTAAVVGVGAALSGVGAAGAVFGAVFKSSFTQVQEASQKTDALREKVRLLGEEARIAPTDDMRGKYLQQQAKAAIELQARLNLLPPATRNVVSAYGGLKTAWSNFIDQNKPQTYAIMTGGFSLLSTIIPRLQPLFDVASAAVRRLVTSLTAAASGGGMSRLVTWLTAQAGPAISNLSGIAKNLGSVLAGAFAGFAPVGQGILAWANQATAKLAGLAKGGGLQAFVSYATTNGPRVVALLSTIAAAAVRIVQGVSPLAPISLAVATALGAIVAALPPAVITGLVAAFVAYGVAMKVYYGYTVIASAATKVWAAAQWLLNVAMDANPIGLIVIAIAAVAVAVYLLWTHSSGFRSFFIGMWNDIWGFLKTVGAWFAGPFVNFFVKAGKDIAAPFTWLWHNIISPVWNGIYTTISTVMAFVTNIIVSFANLFLYLGNQIFQPVWRNVIKPVFDAMLFTARLTWTGVAAGALWLWHNVLQPVGQGIAVTLRAVGAAASWLWRTAFEPAFRGIGAAGRAVWNTVLRPTFNAVASAVRVLGGVFKSVFGSIGGFISRAFSGAVGILRGTLNGLFHLINRAIGFIDNNVIGVANRVPGVSFPKIPYVPYLAAGGDITRGGIAVVGERGPEPVYLPAGASVASHSSLGAAMAGGGVQRFEAAPGDQVAQMLLSLLRPVIRGTYGGDVNLALAGRRA